MTIWYLCSWQIPVLFSQPRRLGSTAVVYPCVLVTKLVWNATNMGTEISNHWDIWQMYTNHYVCNITAFVRSEQKKQLVDFASFDAFIITFEYSFIFRTFNAWRRKRCIHSEHMEQVAQWCGVICQKNRILQYSMWQCIWQCYNS